MVQRSASSPATPPRRAPSPPRRPRWEPLTALLTLTLALSACSKPPSAATSARTAAGAQPGAQQGSPSAPGEAAAKAKEHAAQRAAQERAAAQQSAAATKAAALKAAVEKAKAAAKAKADAKPDRVAGQDVAVRQVGPWKQRSVPKPAPQALAPLRAPKSVPPAPAVPLSEDVDPSALLRAREAWLKEPRARKQSELLDIRGGRTAQVVDTKGRSVPMAVVDIHSGGKIVWRARTYGDGKMRFYPGMAAGGGAQQSAAFQLSTVELASRAKATLAPGQRSATLKLPGTWPDRPVKLDIAVIVDATASMAPLLASLQRALPAALKKLDVLKVPVAVRIGAVAFRDAGDAFVTARRAFTRDVGAFVRDFATLKATGGGDTPDALGEGLRVALDDLAWGRVSAKVCLLVTDAPPGTATEGDQPFTSSTIRASALGIRIHSVLPVGADPYAAYTLRQISHLTRGQLLPVPTQGGDAALTRWLFDRLHAAAVGWSPALPGAAGAAPPAKAP